MSDKLNIIFDLDDTLIQTPNYNFSNGATHTMNLPEVCNIGIINTRKCTSITYLRPYLKELLEYCYDNFNVSFWTAGNYFYCIEILKIILTEEQYEKTKIVLSRWDHTHLIEIKSNLTYTNENLNILHFKPLRLLYENYKNLNFTDNNTIIIDDNIYICDFNKKNSINIIKFDRFNNNDIALLELLEWLKKGDFRDKKINFNIEDNSFLHL
jgi:hypothetical protein